MTTATFYWNWENRLKENFSIRVIGADKYFQKNSLLVIFKILHLAFPNIGDGVFAYITPDLKTQVSLFMNSTTEGKMYRSVKDLDDVREKLGQTELTEKDLDKYYGRNIKLTLDFKP